MYVKKNLLLWVAVFALALPLMLVGTASAKYIGDGATQNGTTGGWDLPADAGVCISGIKSDGTINIAAGITSRPDCLANIFPAYTTSAACKTGNATEGSHYWASTCIVGTGTSRTAISLTGLDRTASMCAQKGGTWQADCTSTWTNMGPSGNGTDGFCYTKVNVSDVYADQASCPSATTFGYAWGTLYTGATTTAYGCIYNYGVAGKVTAKLSNMAGGTYAAAASTVNLAGLGMGQCLFNGASFSNHTTAGGTAPLGTSTIATPITNVRAGCLSCHNNTTQYNSVSGRWKSAYLKTGHKNMLRKVTAGANWAGADGVVYTTDGTGAINFATGMYTAATGSTAGVATQLFYVYGDWMAPLPSVVYNNSLTDPLATNGYSCAACHTTGWRNEDTTKGVCSLSSKTLQSACTASGGTWYPSSGTQGYGKGGAEPAASFSGIKGVTGTWDVNGIVCTRCHKVAYDPTLPLNADGYNAPAGFTTHETDIFEGAAITNICYGCHQSPAKTLAGAGADIDLNHPEYIPVKNTSTVISSTNPTGYIPEWNGHVLGNSFLNSPHSKFTGTIVPNSVSKYDIAGGTYASAFKGNLCRSSTTLGGGSVLETKADGSEIKTLADCNRANGKPVGDTTSYGYWQAEDQGSCSTCHDVHQSLFAAGGEPLRRECETCHEDNGGAGGAGYQAAGFPQVNMGMIAHPKSANTPFDTNLYANACEVCHMPKATSGGFPMHVWRINTNAAYSSFPTKAEFYGGSCSVHTSAADVSSAGCTAAGGTWTSVTKKQIGVADASVTDYAGAVSVDVDLACGQCHGGSTGTVRTGAIYISKADLANFAVSIHNKPAAPPVAPNTAPVSAGTATLAGWTMTVVDSSTDAETAAADLKVAINWGDGKVSVITAGTTTTHTYTRAKFYTIVQTVTDKGDVNGSNVKINTKKYAPIFVPTRVNVGGAATTGTFVSLKKNGHTVKATKAASGAYNFSNVLPGTYTIRAYLSSIGTTTTAPFAVDATDVTQNLP